MFRFWSTWRLHGLVGVWLSAWVLWMVVSGVLMNHAADFGLIEAKVGSALITPGQARPAPDRQLSYRLGESYISQFGQQLYRDDQLFADCEEPLVGAVVLSQVQVVACADQLLLLTPAGELIEQMRVAAVGLGTVTAVASVDDRLVVNTVKGPYQADSQLIEFNSVEGVSPTWVLPAQLPELLATDLLQESRRISWFSWLVDLHTGRIFGLYGPYFVDFLGLLLIMVSLTGYLLQRRRTRFTRRARKL